MKPAPTAGYSGTPLAKKLGLKPGFRCFVTEADYVTRFDELPDDLTFVAKPTAPLDFAHVFVASAADLTKRLTQLLPILAPSGMIWVSWPKKASKVPTDVTEDTIRDVCLPMGLVDVKVCAVDDVWSGLKLVVRVELRKK